MKTINCWKSLLRQNFTKWENLADYLNWSVDQRDRVLKYSRFPLSLPLRLASKIKKGTLDDPLLKQFLPTFEEEILSEGFSEDPVGQLSSRKEAKLVHKYQGRVLIMATSACAMHCRYCYRRHFPYECEDKSFDKELELIQNDSSIKEVIVSGGDPLSLDDRILKRVVDRLNLVPHLRRLRFHSRFPIGIPERINTEFLSIFKSCSKSLWFVIHCNHPEELDEEIFDRLSLLRDTGFNVLNQSVLLKGVNDRIEVLQTLFETLVDHNIIPYYLHQLDRVQGASHFEVSEEKGWELMRQLAEKLPGYAVPKYVKEMPGDTYKALVPSSEYNW